MIARWSTAVEAKGRCHDRGWQSNRRCNRRAARQHRPGSMRSWTPLAAERQCVERPNIGFGNEGLQIRLANSRVRPSWGFHTLVIGIVVMNLSLVVPLLL